MRISCPPQCLVQPPSSKKELMNCPIEKKRDKYDINNMYLPYNVIDPSEAPNEFLATHLNKTCDNLYKIFGSICV